MKKKRELLLALLLCICLMMGSLAGCGKEETQETVQNGQGDTGSGTVGDIKENETGNAEDEILTELPSPLCEEKLELTVWTFFSNSFVEDPNEIAGVQEMENRTNVHINWIPVGSAEMSEKFGLMIASGDIPDIIYAGGANLASYPGGIAKGVEDGVFLEVTELVEKYMPNYRAQRLSDAELAKDTMSDDGRLLAVYNLVSTDTEIAREREWDGLAVRKDMLDDWGLEVPETIDDWYEVLTTAKKNGVEAPLMVGASGSHYNHAFLSAYGVLYGFYQENGVVKYGPAEEGYRQWLETMSKWYEEGLIDPNFVSNNTVAFCDLMYSATGRTVAFPTMVGWTANAFQTNGLTEDEDMYVLPVKNPVLNEGDTPLASRTTASACGTPTYIGANSENPELAAMWLDYQYTEEGMLLNYYGIEGLTYEVDDNGEIQMTDLVLNNPDGYTPSDAKNLYCRDNGLGRYNTDRNLRVSTDQVSYNEAYDTWTAQDFSKYISEQVSMTDAEGTEYNTTYTAIATLVEEQTVKYIIGEESLDTFDDFVESLYSYGLQTCIDIKQAALDRYNKRAE